MVRAGELVIPGGLYSSSETLNAAGEVTKAKTWTKYADAFAKIEATGGGESVESDRPSGRRSAAITIRYRSDVTHGHQFRTATRSYDIVAVDDPDGMREKLMMRCVEAV